MSIKLMTLVWDMPDLAPGPRLVLLCLADQANDQGTHCWPSVETICRRSGQKERTVRRILADLESAGHITRHHRNGTSTQYRVHPCQNGTPAKMAPLPNRQVTPAKLAPTPCQIGTQTTNEPSLNLTPPTPRRGEERVRPSEIPIEWQAPAIDDLPREIAGLARHWPAGAYAAECAAFHQHWRGRGTRRADWAALWAARVQARHAEVMRAAKAGVVFDEGGAAGKAAAVSADRAPVAAKSREGSRAAEVHAALSERLGQRIWQQWFDPVALLFDADGLVVIAPSAFHAAQLEAQYGPALAEVLDCLNIGVDWARFSAERGAAAAADKRGTTRKTGGAKRG